MLGKGSVSCYRNRKENQFFLEFVMLVDSRFQDEEINRKREAAGRKIEGRKIDRRCLKIEFLRKKLLYHLVAFYKECSEFRSQQETVVGTELYDY